jgi:hypothetical protein
VFGLLLYITLYIHYYIILYNILLFHLSPSNLSSSILPFQSIFSSVPIPYNPLLFFSSLLYPPLIHSILVGTYIYLFIFNQDIYLFSFPFFCSIFPSSSFQPAHSFYTCRYLHILIYIPSTPIIPSPSNI